MKTPVKLLLGILFLVGVVLVAALFVDREYTVERDIVINKPTAEVFTYIRHLKNQDHYNKWVMTDPAMKKEFSGTDGTVGFVYAWNGNDEAGEGEQEIKSLREGQSLELEIRFIRPFKGLAKVPMRTEAVSANQTRVTWGMTGTQAYPFNLMNLFIDGVLGKDLETSLTTLKGVLEKNQAPLVTR